MSRYKCDSPFAPFGPVSLPLLFCFVLFCFVLFLISSHLKHKIHLIPQHKTQDSSHLIHITKNHSSRFNLQDSIHNTNSQYSIHNTNSHLSMSHISQELRNNSHHANLAALPAPPALLLCGRSSGQYSGRERRRIRKNEEGRERTKER
jgi:hypothetical protein